jgi:hypothetical protein
MLCGLVARVTDPAALEATLARMADQLSATLRTNAAVVPRMAHSRAMIRYGNGRYMDPEGGFFSFAITDRAAIVMVEFEGDPKAPTVENEMRLCLAQPTDNTTATPDAREQLPSRAISRDGVVSLWIDADRFCNNLPKNPAAQARFQQLQRYVGFDLVLKVQPGGGDKLNLIADYAYQADRFKDRQQPTAVQKLASLGSVESAGIAGKLMDRCADTLDYDSFIERLRLCFSTAQKQGVEDVVVEKSFLTDRSAQFVLTAHCNPQLGPPLLTALNTIWQ